jgi:hypothetical protein
VKQYVAQLVLEHLSCFSLLNAGITGRLHHTQLGNYFQ